MGCPRADVIRDIEAVIATGHRGRRERLADVGLSAKQWSGNPELLRYSPGLERLGEAAAIAVAAEQQLRRKQFAA
jgi:hypothetical protein